MTTPDLLDEGGRTCLPWQPSIKQGSLGSGSNGSSEP